MSTLTPGTKPTVSSNYCDYDLVWIERVKARCVITESGCWLWAERGRRRRQKAAKQETSHVG